MRKRGAGNRKRRTDNTAGVGEGLHGNGRGTGAGGASMVERAHDEKGGSKRGGQNRLSDAD